MQNIPVIELLNMELFFAASQTIFLSGIWFHQCSGKDFLSDNSGFADRHTINFYYEIKFKTYGKKKFIL